MPKRIPISAMKELAEKYGLTHVVLLAHDGYLDHVVTYGKSIQDCSRAADFGNILKEKMGWPESLQAQPSRVREIQAKVKELEGKLGEREATILQLRKDIINLADKGGKFLLDACEGAQR